MPPQSDTVLGLCLHGIGDMPADRPEDERPYWLDVDAFDRLLSDVRHHNRKRRIKLELSFDDANRSDIAIVLPRLIDAGLTGHFFVSVGALGAPDRLSADDVRELARAGMMIGSHGIAHTDWTTLARDEAEREIDGAKTALEDILSAPVTTVAPPYGAWTKDLADHARETGHTQFFTCHERPGPRSRFFQHRLVVRADIDFRPKARLKTSLLGRLALSILRPE